jgi:hypothetical protein
MQTSWLQEEIHCSRPNTKRLIKAVLLTIVSRWGRVIHAQLIVSVPDVKMQSVSGVIQLALCTEQTIFAVTPSLKPSKPYMTFSLVFIFLPFHSHLGA